MPGSSACNDMTDTSALKTSVAMKTPAAQYEASPLGVVQICGVPMHNVTFPQVLEIIDDRIRRRAPGYIVTPNVDHICRYNREAEFRELYANAFLSLADGTPVMWVGRLLRKPIKQKISGSDMVFWLTEHAAKQGHSVFLFGAAEGVAEKAAERLTEMYPGLRIAGTYCPPLGFEKNTDEAAQALDAVKAANPDICYVALGAPKQERWMSAYAVPAGVPVSLGIGAGLDFVIGKEKRAPVWAQRSGIEWLWRLAQDPKRLAKRYFIDDALFFRLVLRDLAGAGAGRAKRDGASR